MEASEKPERDPRLIHMLDQESAAFNDNSDNFEQTFGFKHYCTCDVDYSEGRVGEVTECYDRLCQEAMHACSTLKTERDQAIALLEQMNQLNQYLLDLLAVKEDDASERLDSGGETEVGPEVRGPSTAGETIVEDGTDPESSA